MNLAITHFQVLYLLKRTFPTVPAPNEFWRSVWLMVIAFVLVIGTMYIFFKLRASTFRRVRKMLEERVIFKTKQLSEKNEELEKLSIAVSQTNNAIAIINSSNDILYSNQSFIKLQQTMGVAAEPHLHIAWYPGLLAAVSQCIQTKEATQFESELQSEGQWLSTSLTPLLDPQGNILKIVVVATDISTQKMMQRQIQSSLVEKDALIKEIHHRVKNNLQIIISLLNLQSNYIKDEATLKAVTDGQNRVRSMALVHEKFYQSEELSEIDFIDYTHKLCKFLYQSYGNNNGNISLLVDGDPIKLNMDTAMPVALLINEIVSNSYKYAFDESETGTIHINFQQQDKNTVQLTLSDTGRGMPSGFVFEDTDTLGMQLIAALTSQIDGQVAVSCNQGVAFTITFPYQKT
ncbi:MAG: hypothetical protein RIQ89_1194 [Bacteroidota bacterium]|jgi:two-component sensor histidine kinase/PAS domain-containing protein